MDLGSRPVLGVLSSDMSTAFDSVIQPLIIKKLKPDHFLESALNLLRSYYFHRQNRLRWALCI